MSTQANPLQYLIYGDQDQNCCKRLGKHSRKFTLAERLDISPYEDDEGCLCFADLYEDPMRLRLHIHPESCLVLTKTSQGFQLNHCPLLGKRSLLRTTLLKPVLQHRSGRSFDDLAQDLEASIQVVVSDEKEQLYYPLQKINQRALALCNAPLFVMTHRYVSLCENVVIG